MSCVFFTIEDDQLLDIVALLNGDFKVSETTRLFALSPLNASKSSLSVQDIAKLLRIPADSWTAAEELVESGIALQWLESMAHRGLLLSDEDESAVNELRRRAQILETEEWHPYAALYHFMTRGSESQPATDAIDYEALEAQSPERARRLVANHGPPPPPFHSVSSTTRIELPLIHRAGGDLHEVLRNRKTTRAFDTTVKTSFEDVATLLQVVFGCHGYCRLAPEVLAIHRTSPSGGARHPVEVYPLVLRVAGLGTGLYHYDMENHALELMQEYELEQAQALATEIAGGQGYAGSAHVLFVMTARYYRNHWKYRSVSRTYGVILMDVAHLSQTLYLVATDLNLGTFFSAALNAPRADAILGLDGYREGAVAICGCGVKSPPESPDHGLPFRQFVPRKTKNP